MSSYYFKEDEMFGKKTTTVIVKGDNADDLRESFENALKDIRPEPNQFQKDLYGEDHLKSLPDEAIREIVKEGRGMGSTTAQALSQIVEAIRNPNKPIELAHDHGKVSLAATWVQYKYVVQEIINKLDFKFMVINDVSRTLTFKV